MSDLEEPIEEPIEEIYNNNEEFSIIFPINKEVHHTITPFIEKILIDKFKWWVIVYDNQLSELFNIFIRYISQYNNNRPFSRNIEKKMFYRTIFNYSSRKIHPDCIDNLL